MKKIIVIKNNRLKQSGQSIVELVFSIIVIGLVITGSVVLIVNTIGIKDRSLERKKAMEMADLVMESLVDQKKNSSDNFWNLEVKTGETLPGFSGYSYNVGYSGVDCDGDECATAFVEVNWGNNESLEISKFFAREVNF